MADTSVAKTDSTARENTASAPKKDPTIFVASDGAVYSTVQRIVKGNPKSFC
jgi:hypothetical protein